MWSWAQEASLPDSFLTTRFRGNLCFRSSEDYDYFKVRLDPRDIIRIVNAFSTMHPMITFDFAKIGFDRIRKFLIVGGTAFVIQMGMMVFFVEVVGIKEYLLKNLANFVSGEIALLYAFVLNRSWTWKDIPKQKGKELLRQLSLFHAANGIGIIIKLTLFAVLEFLGVHYTLNVIIGVTIAAAFDFVMYNRFVFHKKLV
jgi:putative flippase GtrA